MQGLPGDAIVIALGLLLGVLLVWVWPVELLARYRVELGLLGGMLLLPLIRLPPVLWTHFAGRAALVLPRRDLERLIAVVLLVAIASTVLGFAQLAGEPQSPLRPYAITDPDDAVGLFANRNHYVAYLCSALALACGVLIKGWIDVYRDRDTRVLAHLFRAMTVMVLILGLAIARSRAASCSAWASLPALS